ncbi:hypothetical protein T12_12887 [Trichinella patagoniensis]|uniref:Uncharacterized protein n=1 Tax=Trichinella patagoniensis TaxID=990121 RepID=A0A0V0X7Q7_9BILA|nr:hypothetical protein T12_12887 [Trichinella patagoniensis]
MPCTAEREQYLREDQTTNRKATVGDGEKGYVRGVRLALDGRVIYYGDCR